MIFILLQMPQTLRIHKTKQTSNNLDRTYKTRSQVNKKKIFISSNISSWKLIFFSVASRSYTTASRKILSCCRIHCCSILIFLFVTTNRCVCKVESDDMGKFIHHGTVPSMRVIKIKEFGWVIATDLYELLYNLHV